MIDAHPIALQLRNLQVLGEIAVERNSTIIFRPSSSTVFARSHNSSRVNALLNYRLVRAESFTGR